MLICIEGINGSGEGTNANILLQRLKAEGYNASLISFPDYKTPIGLEIKNFLKGKRDFRPEIRQFLYAANRWERKENIERWLKEGRIVVANRYTPSGLAYGLANNLDLEWMLSLERGLPGADLIVVIDVSVATHFKRTVKKDVYESDKTFLTKVRASYKKLAKQFKWQVINGERSLEKVSREVWSIVANELS
jgi:dTMP kinase